MAKPPRARKQRRVRERAARKLVRDRERLAALEPGGSAERPIVVVSAAVVEPRAQGTPCIQCGGGLRLNDVEAVSSTVGRRRLAHLVCTRCHAPRQMWFAIAPGPN